MKTKEYSAMLYALADELDAEEGCTTEDPETIREAAQRMDELTVTIRGMEIQHNGLLKAAEAVVDRWDTPLWKDVPHTAEFINELRTAIANLKGGAL